MLQSGPGLEWSNRREEGGGECREQQEGGLARATGGRREGGLGLGHRQRQQHWHSQQKDGTYIIQDFFEKLFWTLKL